MRLLLFLLLASACSLPVKRSPAVRLPALSESIIPGSEFSPEQLSVLQTLAIPLGAYLMLYKPIERTKAVFSKVEELLRVGQSQDLLADLENYKDDDVKKK